MPPLTDDSASPSLSFYDCFESPQDALEDAEACLSDIDRKIAHLQVQRAEKIRIIDEYREKLNIQSMFNRLLTDDILYAIFTILVHDQHGWRRCPYPWILAAICKRWRRVCLEHPKLWSEFRFGSTHHCREGNYDVAPVLRTLLQIERSESSSLHIILRSQTCRCPSQVAIFQALVDHSERWGKLSLIPLYGVFWGDSEADSDRLRKLFPPDAKFTGLKEIHWQPRDGAYVFADHLHTLPFSDCSQLTSLHKIALVNFSATFDIGMNFPWGQLTSLRIGSTGHHRELLLALANCQLLASLAIFFACGTWEDVDMEEGSIVLPNLKTVSIGVDAETVNTPAPNGVAIPVIPYLRLPSLTSLKVGDFHREGLLSLITDLIKRSSCADSLHYLALSFGYSKDHLEGDFGTLLQKTTQIRRLKLEHRWSQHRSPDPNGSNQIVRSLILEGAEANPSWLCSHLENIHLAGIDPDPMILMRMLDSRIQRGHSRGQTRNAQHSLRRVKWNYSRKDEEYAFCKTLLERRYSESNLILELSQDKY